jgi:hypothetical protein
MIARTTETSVDIQLRTRQYIPEDSELHNRRLENLKYHIIVPDITLTWEYFEYSLLFGYRHFSSFVHVFLRKDMVPNIWGPLVISKEKT